VLQLALLQIIANAVNPMAATDPQSLLSSANVNGYNNYGMWPLLELALLQIIANGINSNAASGYINYAGPPTSTPPAIAYIVVDVNGRQWQYWGGAWH